MNRGNECGTIISREKSEEEKVTRSVSAFMERCVETHNEKNVDFYKNFGFQVYGIVEKNFPLKQYCLIREYQ